MAERHRKCYAFCWDNIYCGRQGGQWHEQGGGSAEMARELGGWLRRASTANKRCCSAASTLPEGGAAKAAGCFSSLFRRSTASAQQRTQGGVEREAQSFTLKIRAPPRHGRPAEPLWWEVTGNWKPVTLRLLMPMPCRRISAQCIRLSLSLNRICGMQTLSQRTKNWNLDIKQKLE